MCEKHVFFAAAVDNKDTSQSLVWVSTPEREKPVVFFVVRFRTCWSYRSRKQNVFLQRFGKLLFQGTLKNVPSSVNELLANFREESSGIGRFRGLVFQRMETWPNFDEKNETTG